MFWLSSPDVRLAVLGEADDTEEEVLFHQRPLPLRTGWTLEDNHDHDPEVIQCCHGAQRQEQGKKCPGGSSIQQSTGEIIAL